MRQTRHITVAVPLDLCLQSRRLAAGCDSTVTAMVAHILEGMPMYPIRANYPKVGGPRGPVRGRAQLAREEAERRVRVSASAPKPSPTSAQQKTESSQTAIISPASQADSITSAIPLEAITAAVCLYGAVTNSESGTWS